MNSSAVHDLDQLVKAPGRIRVFTRENNNGDLRSFNGFHKRRPDSFPFLKSLFVDVGAESVICQGGIEGAGEGMASLATETQEYVVIFFVPANTQTQV